MMMLASATLTMIRKIQIMLALGTSAKRRNKMLRLRMTPALATLVIPKKTIRLTMMPVSVILTIPQLLPQLLLQ